MPEDARDAMIVLALPLRRIGIAETSMDSGLENFARHRAVDSLPCKRCRDALPRSLEQP